METQPAHPSSRPGSMYRRAVLRAYAESVGLDHSAPPEETALASFERTFEVSIAPPPVAAAPAVRPVAASPPVRAQVPRRRSHSDRRVLWAGLLMTLAGVGFMTRGTGQDASQDRPLRIERPAPTVTSSPVTTSAGVATGAVTSAAVIPAAMTPAAVTPAMVTQAVAPLPVTTSPVRTPEATPRVTTPAVTRPSARTRSTDAVPTGSGRRESIRAAAPSPAAKIGRAHV